MASPAKPNAATIISRCAVKPVSVSESSKQPFYLTPWDLVSLNYEYGQFGLLFNKPGDGRPIGIILDRLKNSLAATLAHFFPFSGRLVTQNLRHPPSYCVYIDCKDSPGAEFVHAVASDVTVSDILTPTDVPLDVIASLFAIAPGTANNCGHTMSLLVVQVTQLVDGIFVGFSMNHAVVDGTSAWHFINSYSEANRSTNNRRIPRPPVTNPWFINKKQVYIPGSHPVGNAGSAAHLPGTYRQRVFHFTSKAMAQLKTKASINCHGQTVSFFKALAALIWRSTTRARGLRGDQVTTCVIPINSRSRLEPPLSDDYFGNCITHEFVRSRVDELLSNDLGCAASKLHNQILGCDNNRVRTCLENFSTADCSMDIGDPGLLFLGSSPRFNIYDNDFGWGKPVGVRWSGEMVDGYVHILPGRDEGSVDLMISLFAKFMNALELDEEFVSALSFVPLSKI